MKLWHTHHILRMKLQVTHIRYDTLLHPAYTSDDAAGAHWLLIWKVATSTIFSDDTAETHWLDIWEFATFTIFTDELAEDRWLWIWDFVISTIFSWWHCRRSISWDMKLCLIHYILLMTLQNLIDMGYDLLPHPPYSPDDTTEPHWLGIWDFVTSTIFFGLHWRSSLTWYIRLCLIHHIFLMTPQKVN